MKNPRAMELNPPKTVKQPWIKLLLQLLQNNCKLRLDVAKIFL
jgi:hypothetical protein